MQPQVLECTHSTHTRTQIGNYISIGSAGSGAITILGNLMTIMIHSARINAGMRGTDETWQLAAVADAHMPIL